MTTPYIPTRSPIVDEKGMMTPYLIKNWPVSAIGTGLGTTFSNGFYGLTVNAPDNTAELMMGCGSVNSASSTAVATFTPTTTGIFLLVCNGFITSADATATSQVVTMQFYYGSTPAPAPNTDPVLLPAFPTNWGMEFQTCNLGRLPDLTRLNPLFLSQAIIPENNLAPLAIGQTYWMDVSFMPTSNAVPFALTAYMTAIELVANPGANF